MKFEIDEGTDMGSSAVSFEGYKYGKIGGSLVGILLYEKTELHWDLQMGLHMEPNLGLMKELI